MAQRAALFLGFLLLIVAGALLVLPFSVDVS